MKKRGRRRLSQSSAIRGGFLTDLLSVSTYLISIHSSVLACFSFFLLSFQVWPATSVSFKHSPVLIRQSLSPTDLLFCSRVSATYPSCFSSHLLSNVSPVTSADLLCRPYDAAVSPSLSPHSIPVNSYAPRTAIAAAAASVPSSSSCQSRLASCSSPSRFSVAAGSASSLSREAATVCPSWSSASAAAAPAAPSLQLHQHRQQHNSCRVHAFLNGSRSWPSRQKVRGNTQSLFSCWRRPCFWAPQLQQQQQQYCCQGSSSVWGRHRETAEQDEAGRSRSRRRSSDNNSGYAGSVASTIALKRERRHGTALFDSREERFSALKSLKEQETPKFQADDWTPEMPLLEVKDLHVAAVEDGEEILKGVNLTVMPGEVHAIMGRNGSGKSTLSKVLAGYPSYKVTRGTVRYKGLDLLQLPIDNRGLAGLFLAFQYPIEIPMVSNLEFLRVAFNERRKWRGEEDIDSDAFREFVEGKLQEVGLESSFLTRPLNYGFSGGEKKRNEILQMIVLDPELVMLDETDSGLDVDSFNVTAAAIKRFAAGKNKSFLVTTHYKKLLDVLLPHKIHVMHAGRVILSGDMSLASRIEKEGFASLISDDPREEENEKKGLARGENLLDNDEVYEPPSLSPSAAGGGRRDFDKLL